MGCWKKGEIRFKRRRGQNVTYNGTKKTADKLEGKHCYRNLNP